MRSNPAPMDSRGYYRTPTIAGDTIVFVCEDDLWSVARRRRARAPAHRRTRDASRCRGSRPTARRSPTSAATRATPEVYTIPAQGGPPRRLTFLGQRGALRQRLVAPTAARSSSPPMPACRSSRRRVAFAIDRDGGATAPAAGRPRDGDRRRGERRDADRPQQPRPRALEALSRRHGGPSVGRRGRHAERSRASGATSTATSCGRCGWASASSSSPTTKGSANLYSRAPRRIRAAPPHRRTRRTSRAIPRPTARASSTPAAARSSLLDPRDGTTARVAIETPSAAPQTARRFVHAADLLETFAPSPDGKALALVSRGHAYTMPLWEAAVSEHGAGNAARRRDSVWLHDGTRIAYVDDASGFERIAVGPRRPERARRPT